MSRPLGKRQQGMLRALLYHGSWVQGGGWEWDGLALTLTILDSLVGRGLVDVDATGRYTLTPSGKMLAPTLKKQF